jgi:secondary thiamine-phosphate synthase enzyme
MNRLQVPSSTREEFVDITSRVQALLQENGWNDGLLTLSSLHTTAALTVNEAADPSVSRDILAALRRLVPREGDYTHSEGNSDAHVKTSLMGTTLQVIVREGRLRLGTWQGIFLTEFDGPRKRTIEVHWTSDAG